MTEQDWLQATDPRPMLEFLRGKVSDRKLRLFAVACCRRALHLFRDKRVKMALDVVERYADGSASEEEVTAIHSKMMSLYVWRWSQAFIAEGPPGWRIVGSILRGTVTPITHLIDEIADMVRASSNDRYAALRAPLGEEVRAARSAWRSAVSARSDERTHQRLLLRDIIGNTFRPVGVDHAWLTPSVVELASTIYSERAFDRMPILADALEEAGCTNQDILNHSRSGSEHVRGCWVVDLVLGKS
jgi:hypothetical protein